MVFTQFWHFEGHGKHIHSRNSKILKFKIHASKIQGILEAWVESYILDPKAAEKAFAVHRASKHTQANTAGYVALFYDSLVKKKNYFIKMLEKSARRRNIFPFMKTVDHMPYDLDTRESIPAFHAFTGSNTASYIAGYSTKST